MLRTCLCSLTGAGLGFLAAFILVGIMSGPEPAKDMGWIVLFLGALLSVGGAIAGAVTGGAADLLEYFKRRDRLAARGKLDSEA